MKFPASPHTKGKTSSPGSYAVRCQGGLFELGHVVLLVVDHPEVIWLGRVVKDKAQDPPVDVGQALVLEVVKGQPPQLALVALDELPRVPVRPEDKEQPVVDRKSTRLNSSHV